MASGRLPFPGDSLRALLHDPPTALVAIRPEIPAAFGRVVARCLEKDPARRYNSAIELQRDLDEVSGSEAAAGLSSRPRIGTSALVAAAVTIVFATAGAASWLFARRAASERAHQAAVEEVEQLVNAGRFVDVWRVASDGVRRWPDDARLQRAMQTSTRCRHDRDGSTGRRGEVQGLRRYRRRVASARHVAARRLFAPRSACFAGSS